MLYELRTYTMRPGKAPEAEVASFESYQDLLRDLIAQAAKA